MKVQRALAFEVHYGVETLVDVREAIQQAFGWLDDHLYSFWLDGRFWGDRSTEYTAPIEPDQGVATADIPIAELDLEPGAEIAYGRTPIIGPPLVRAGGRLVVEA